MKKKVGVRKKEIKKQSKHPGDLKSDVKEIPGKKESKQTTHK